MKMFYIIVKPAPPYWRHFTIIAENPLKAIHTLCYQARQQYLIHKESLSSIPSYENDYIKEYMKRCKEIFTTCRRYRRRYRDIFAHENSYAIKVYELPIGIAYEGHLNMGIGRSNEYVWNIFPKARIDSKRKTEESGS